MLPEFKGSLVPFIQYWENGKKTYFVPGEAEDNTGLGYGAGNGNMKEKTRSERSQE